MVHHSHRFTIADREAVSVLRDKVAARGAQQHRREKLLSAFEKAVKSHNNSDQKDRHAFFHGLATGYAVALKLW